MSGLSTTSTTTLRTDEASKVLPGDKTGLPLEVWQMILSYLSFRDLCRVARVSRTWQDLAASVDLTRWKELYLARREWRHPYWPLDTDLEPSSWRLAFRNQHRATRFWRRCSSQQAAHRAGCMTLLKRVRERQVIEVGPGLQYETLKSAFAVANEYDKILVHPGIYDEQLEMSVKVPFELVGVGELGSVILVLCLEHVALSGRMSNLVLRAPWFTNFILNVKAGYLQMDNCIVEEGMMRVGNPGACHVQFCTFRRATIILQHVNASIIRNCHFSQSNNANIVIEGYPKDEKCWAYPHLCQEMDGLFCQKPSPDQPHPLKVTDSTTSTLHSTFTTKSLTASTIPTLDTASRGRAGSQDVDVEGKKAAGAGVVGVVVASSADSQTSRFAANKTGATAVVVNGQGNGASSGTKGKWGSGGRVVDGGSSSSNRRNQCSTTDHRNAVVCLNTGDGADGGGGHGNPYYCGCAKEGGNSSSSPCCVCQCECGSGPCCDVQRVACLAESGRTCGTNTADGEWLEINDERKAWQMVGEEKRDKDVGKLPPHSQGTSQQDKSDRHDATTTVKSSEKSTKNAVSSDSQPVEVHHEGSPSHEHWAGEKCEGGGNSNGHNCDDPLTPANGYRPGHCTVNGPADQCSHPCRNSGEKYQIPDPKPLDLTATCVVLSGSEVTSNPTDRSKAKEEKEEGETAPQVVSLYRSVDDGSLSEGGGDMFPQNLPPLNSNPTRHHHHHHHNPALLHNPHPHPSAEHQQTSSSVVQQPPQPGAVEHPLPTSGGVAEASAEAAERGSQRSFHSSRDGGNSSEDDDLSILQELEAEASSSGGSDRGNDSSSSSEDESEVEEFFHGNSEYDSSDAEESVIMLPHLRQKHLDASLSANAVNADVDSICSQASPPITLNGSQDEGVLSQVHRVRGSLVHQCRMMHSKGGVMVSLQGHALVSACDISNVSYGIRCIQNARVVVVKNRIHHCRTSGIFMRLAASGLIAGNDLHSNNEAGLDIRKNADPIVQHNRIHHGKRSGVVVLGSGRGHIRCNSIYSNTEAGIYILYGGNPTVSENHIYDGKAAGVAVNEGGQGFIFDNSISGNQWGGVDIRRGSCPMVCRNTITNGLGDGIVIGDQGQGAIENNVISDNAGCGVWLMSASRPYIHGNQISNNGDTGVMMVNKTDIQQDSPHMLAPGGGGVGVGEGGADLSGSYSVMMGGEVWGDDLPHPSPKCSHTTLQHNSIFHNAGRGVTVELGDRVEVRYNAIYANQQDGVWVHQGAPVSLLANSITGNHGHGVVTALTPSVEVVGNGIYDNQEWGVQGSGSLCVRENDVVGNQQGGVMLHSASTCKIQDNRIQTPFGPAVKVVDAEGEGSVVEVEGNTLFGSADGGTTVQDLSQAAVVRDNRVLVAPPTSQADRDPAPVSRHKFVKDGAGFNKAFHLRDPPPRPAVHPPPPPSTLPPHNVSTVTKVMVPSGDPCQQGSKLCLIL
ncbi:uncharacterized protein LOC143290910 [Babylonia areolata]|uniref:uncharacterized protein LOC143290910 n=1 Tax=Babylonia areolata TaxID=304850 RepID=UPI003FD5B48C